MLFPAAAGAAVAAIRGRRLIAYALIAIAVLAIAVPLGVGVWWLLTLPQT